ncbi:MAG: 3-dehydroquinate synthase [bacterium]
MQTINVELGERSYPIHIGAGILQRTGEWMREKFPASRLVLVTNPVVDQHWSMLLISSLEQAGFAIEKLMVPDGERHKTLATFNRLIAKMLQARCDRETVVLALGGGVIGDLAGFVAAAYMRGVRFVQIPTTLLAQVDASIGGKVGVNHRLGKNMIGAFHQPQMVVIDTDSLATLPHRELICGLAEIIKHALIADASYFEIIEQNLPHILALDSNLLTPIIAQSCRIKAEIVSRDEREESGLRALLNFGHTVGHALEAAGKFDVLRHGEAVLLGMLAEAYLSKIAGTLTAPDFQRLDNFLRRLPLTVELAGIHVDEVGEFMQRDKKAQRGAPRLVLLHALGAAACTALWPRAHADEATRYAVAAFTQKLN